MAKKKSRYSITDFEQHLDVIEAKWRESQKQYEAEGKNVMIKISQDGIGEVEMIRKYIQGFKELKLREQWENLYKNSKGR